MALTAAQQQKVASIFAQVASSVWQELPNIQKADLLAAVGDADTWVDDNQGSYNTALSNPFKTNATTTQKTLLLVAVAAADYLLNDPQAAQMFSALAGKLNEVTGV